jgi:hypothetical protein
MDEAQDLEARREARARNWTSQVFRDAALQEMDVVSRNFWLSIPADERAAAVWELSVEAFGLTNPETYERRLPRSAYRVERR